MPKCRNCGMELGPEKTCVFATFKVEKDGQELLVCCERCAGLLEEAPPPEAAPVHEVATLMPPTAPKPAKKAPKKPAPRKVKRAAGKVKRAARKVKRATRKVKRATRAPLKKAPKKAKRAAGKTRRPARKAAKKAGARRRR